MDETRTKILGRALLTVGLVLGPVTASLAADGAELYRAKICHTCHGERPNEPVLPAYPKLSGQNAGYLFQQMKDIRDGNRTNGLSVAMKAVVGSVTDEEFQVIANWLATQ
ncbi:cytochrome c class I [Thiorhodococcus drewsii AZ1]|uniref:Cytochrome c class I n=1 Tax=Thiorhodococcus drewsii AZ1 TaxID=765913 RepID=G2DX44_9GAMM|nr:cytochrome c [Thiorhodococcus drewsii]EGV33398.1 cytochrome c class I [Thiorhodococcus drewsii AZ1]